MTKVCSMPLWQMVMNPVNAVRNLILLLIFLSNFASETFDKPFFFLLLQSCFTWMSCIFTVALFACL